MSAPYLDTEDLPGKLPRRSAQRGRPSSKNPQIPGVPKQWQCSWHGCPKSFGRKSDLIRHHHTHTGTRNHKCWYEGCGKTFIQTSALTVHIRTHTGEKPHQCQMCSKRFSDSSSLARHRKIHSNERPYACKVEKCDRSFCRKSTLNKHMNREHPGVAHSPGTDDSDDEPSSGSVKGEAGFSNADQVSQANGLGLQSPFIKSDVGAFHNPSQYRRVAQAPRLMSHDYYSHTQPSTPTMQDWQGTAHSQSQNVTPRNNSLPLQIKNFNTMPYHEVGPMATSIVQSEQYRGHQGAPQAAQFMPADFTYYQDVSGVPTPVPVYNQDGSMAIHPPMLPSHGSEVHSDAQRVLQAHVKAEQLVSGAETPNALTQAPEIYAYTSQEYQEPVNLGVTAGFAGHYQLPGTDMHMWGMTEEEKYGDTFGEPTPGQLANYGF